MIFKDRQDAGKRLAERLSKAEIKNGVVIGLARGGVVVADEISKKLKLPIDALVVKKISSPISLELAIGATCATGKPYLDKDLIESMNVDRNFLETEISAKRQEAKKQDQLYHKHKKKLKLTAREIILTDDGIATGATVLAAIANLERSHPKKIILATPIASPDIIKKIVSRVDEVLILHQEENFRAVGQFYQNFKQIEDEEVIKILNKQSMFSHKIENSKN